MSPATEVIAALRERDADVAMAESLTGGLVCASLVAVPGASDVVCGGIVAYTADAKTTVLDVERALIDRVGTVDAETAATMAERARTKFGSTYALATTGVAGPDRSEGHEPGTVFVALASPGYTRVESLQLTGDRDDIRNGAVRAALSMLLAELHG